MSQDDVTGGGRRALERRAGEIADALGLLDAPRGRQVGKAAAARPRESLRAAEDAAVQRTYLLEERRAIGEVLAGRDPYPARRAGMPEDGVFLTLDEAAAALGAPVAQVRTWLERTALRGVYVDLHGHPATGYRLRVADVRKFAAARGMRTAGYFGLPR